MRYLDVCAGISASTVAWKPLGWEAAAYSEIEAAPRAILAHHWPDVPCHGDFTTIRGDEYGPIDLLVGGTPCQDFSVAGLRAGLGGDRGNLSLEFLRLADRARPRWLVWENVPGVLSIDGGRAFGAILGGLGQLGYGFAYRILDAQHFGVPQRRRRVFVVGYLGDWRRAAAVLFERHSLSGHPAPRRETREGIARPIAAGSKRGSGYRNDADTADNLIAAFGGNNTAGPIDISTALNSHGDPHGRLDFDSETFIAHSLRGEGFDASEDGTGRGTPLIPVAFSIMPMNSNTDYVGRATDVAQPIMAGGPVGGNQGGDFIIDPVAFGIGSDAVDRTGEGASGRPGDRAGLNIVEELQPSLRARPNNSVAISFQSSQSGMREVETHATLDANNGSRRHNGVIAGSAVRRLTPRECERLQGFPDDYTFVPYRKGMMADGPRYKALGNSMAVPVMCWIGERIAMVETIQQRSAAA